MPTIHLCVLATRVGSRVDALRRVRGRRGLSQQGLADCAGVAKSTVYEAETGRRTLTLDSLEQLADALGVEIADLLPPKKRAADA